MNFFNLANRKPGAWFSVSNVTESTAELYLYDAIGDDWDGKGGAKDWVGQIKALDGKHVHMHINSPGGSVFDASAIVMALGAHKGGLTAHIDGIAASAVSWLALAADKVLMSDTGRFMIHNASSVAWGDCREMRKTADLLEGLNETIASTYAKRSTKSKEDIIEAMNAETWLNAEQAKAWGFVDEIVTGVKARNTLTRDVANALGFRAAPKDLFKQDEAPANTPAASATNNSSGKPRIYFERRLALLEKQA